MDELPSFFHKNINIEKLLLHVQQTNIICVFLILRLFLLGLSHVCQYSMLAASDQGLDDYSATCTNKIASSITQLLQYRVYSELEKEKQSHAYGMLTLLGGFCSFSLSFSLWVRTRMFPVSANKRQTVLQFVKKETHTGLHARQSESEAVFPGYIIFSCLYIFL